MAFLGREYETRNPVSLYDDYRGSGLYILGKPGMGKSTLLVEIMCTDIYEHGLFFIDPHGDAIDDFIKYAHKNNRRSHYYLLNPQEEHYSFGINPLYCRDITSLTERENTYTRAYNIFHKIWEDDWGVWLQLIIQNTLYAFIENPDYTLAEVPLFLINENFRYQLAKNIKYNLDVKDFWLARFEGKKPLDQQRQVDAALTRINTLLGHPYVKHIVGQQKSTLDFNQILSQGEIVLVKLSSALAEDIRKFVGTILISELLHAVRNRPKDNRPHFSICVDEFQNFATSDDFAILITEARKYGIATTIAHQERFGQLGDNKKLLGATLAAANKVFFQLTVKDAQELAPEFAEMSDDMAHRLGPDLVISPHVVEDIWEKGHPTSEIMQYHRRYFWILDLLKKNPENGYYFFNPETVSPEYIREFEGITKTKMAWNEFTDWEDYRASPQMIRQGIALLDDYYYKCMQGKYNPTGQITSEEFEYVWKVIELLGGILGLRGVMESYIASDMREVFVKKMTETKDRAITEMKRNTRYSSMLEWERKELQWELEEVNPDFRINWSVDKLPDLLPFRFNRIDWQNRAIRAGFTQAELSNFIKWRIKKYNTDDEQLLKDFIIFSLGSRSDSSIDYEKKKQAFKKYINVMSAYPYYEKYRGEGIEMPPEKTASYRQIIFDRLFSQLGTMQEFIFYCFCALPTTLMVQPLKVPSGHYQESVKREQNQRELVDKMAQELSSLPRFQAWTKTIQVKEGKDVIENHKIKTEALVNNLRTEGYNSLVLLPTELYSKSRSKIEDEITERQILWKKGLSSPPAEKKKEKQEANTSKRPPPTSFSTQVSGGKENKQEKVEYKSVSDASEVRESKRRKPDSVSISKQNRPGVYEEPLLFPAPLDLAENSQVSPPSPEDTAGKPQGEAGVPRKKRPPPTTTTS